MSFKKGRLPRIFNPKIMHMSAIFGARTIPVPPVSVDWTKGITDFGMMLNDSLGDCTCAGIFHARQIWSANVLTEKTENDDCVLKLYEEATGYRPGDASTDCGGVEQNVLSYLLNVGIPLADGSRDKIIAFMEVDPRNINDIKVTINDFGVCYIGFQVPNSIYENGMPKTKWEYDANHTDTEGGHCVVAVKYDDEYVSVISWGALYEISWEFFTQYTDEAYAIVSPDWIATSGKSPLGMTVAEMEQLMSAIRE
jgi:hypothetical protein